MKFNFDFPRIITFVKEAPEKIISWTLLAIFIFLSLYLAISWPKRTAPLSSEEIAIRGIRKPATETIVSVDFRDLLIRKPVTYYNDFVQRNPFARLPGVVGPGRGENGPPPPPSQEEYICRAIMSTPEGPITGIEGNGGIYYWVKEGDEIEGWKVIKIDEDKVKLYNEKKKKELVLPLGGGPEEKEKARLRREERRRNMQERREKPPIEESGELPMMEE